MPRFSSIRERAAIFIAIYAFWISAYFGVEHRNAGRSVQTLAWDPVRLLPVLGLFVIPYLSAYAMPFLLLFMMRDQAKYRKFAAVIVGTIVACSAVFLIMPLAIERPPLGSASVFDRLLGMLYFIDAPTNLFPSLHVALAFLFSSGVAHVRPRWRGWMLAWACLIAVSTLFTHQHYFVDVLAGIAVAWAAWRIFLKLAK